MLLSKRLAPKIVPCCQWDDFELFRKREKIANWSRMMWQNVVSIAIRVMASGPFGSHFFSEIASVGGI
ncbi:hypothetical protein KIN20_014612 [Parelaphostrongylus tenuis]|uniref:Uncharacterized protein n=1 Tax=Parelaphostrongylus tenuis TaxID=148309 RepID=A0AAD5MWA3_PARTN|nr:hypothetical protein KIN20_014612 [Parelaphostrongylus tenuis]